MSKNKKQTLLTKLPKAIIIASFLVVVGVFFYQVQADDYDRQIKVIEEQINQYAGQSAALRKRANTLVGEIKVLENEKLSIQKQVNQTTAEIKQTELEIKQTKEKIKNNKQILGDVIVKLYLAERVSTLERIASSRNIADFMDEEAQLNSLRYNLNAKIKEIKKQKRKLDKNKKQKEILLARQERQKKSVVAKEQEKQNLLSETKNDENIYRRLIADSNAEIDNLREQQRLANIQYSNGAKIIPGDPNHGGYPYDNVSYPCWYGSNCPDPWGMFKRECVSYTAWKVYQKKGYMPNWGGRGNANQWPASARADGIATGYTPKPGSVAIWMNGRYGHAMWVERINSDGTVRVSQYNYNFDGRYSEMDMNPKSAVYIYF